MDEKYKTSKGPFWTVPNTLTRFDKFRFLSTDLSRIVHTWIDKFLDSSAIALPPVILALGSKQ